MRESKQGGRWFTPLSARSYPTGSGSVWVAYRSYPAAARYVAFELQGVKLVGCPDANGVMIRRVACYGEPGSRSGLSATSTGSGAPHRAQ